MAWGPPETRVVCFMAAQERKSVSDHPHKELKADACCRKKLTAPAGSPSHPFSKTSSVNSADSASYCTFLVSDFGETVKSRNGKWSWHTAYAYLSKDPPSHPRSPSIFTLINGPKRNANCSHLHSPGSVRWLEDSVQRDLACSFSRLIVMEVSRSLPSPRMELLHSQFTWEILVFQHPFLVTQEPSHWMSLDATYFWTKYLTTATQFKNNLMEKNKLYTLQCMSLT